MPSLFPSKDRPHRAGPENQNYPTRELCVASRERDMNKPILPILVSLGILSSALGCKKDPEVSDTMDRLKSEAKQIAAELDDKTFAQRAEFSDRMEKHIASLKVELNELEARVQKTSGTVKEESLARIKELRAKTSQLDTHLEAIKRASESTWESVKAGSKKALSEAQDQFKQMRQKLSEKIAP